MFCREGQNYRTTVQSNQHPNTYFGLIPHVLNFEIWYRDYREPVFIFLTVRLKSDSDVIFFIFVVGTSSMSQAHFLKLPRALQNMSRT